MNDSPQDVAGANIARQEDWNPEDDYYSGPLYVAAAKVYPQSTHGFYRNIKWTVLILTLGVYYILPFLRWNRGPGAPDQAVMVDLPHRRFYFFFIEIWPQEVYYFTGLLILAAMTLFLLNAVAGRVWCGYLCWQTVWTDLFMAVERRVEGDRRERIQLDAQPWNAQKIAKKFTKHFLWILVAAATGGAWVLYFDDAPTLLKQIVTFQAPFLAYLWIGILTATTYAFAGIMREQVCLYMCPWPRIQASLVDENALNVTYRYDRGEPKMSVKKAKAALAHGGVAGECIDCEQCIHVCPTGVDIRQGPNLGCIQCGLCIDACDNVMKKVGRPTRLIAYDTDINIARRQQGLGNIYHLIRPRTILYAVIIVLVGAVMTAALVMRGDGKIYIIHDRNPLSVTLSDGSIRNGYTVRFSNKLPQGRKFGLKVEDASARFNILLEGAVKDAQGQFWIEVGPDRTREERLLLSTSDPLPAHASIPVTFKILDEDGKVVSTVSDFFKGPDAKTP